MTLSRNMETFAVANPSLFAWLEDNHKNSFAQSLASYVERKGDLTPGQKAAVEKAINRDCERFQAVSKAPEVCQDKLMQAFDKARSNKLTRLKIRFDGFFCYPASETSVNMGAVYVKSNDKQYLGKIQNGRFLATRECPSDIASAVVKVMTDPVTEAIAYGKQTGNCAICGRFLENKESVERGIGPICAEKYGF